MEAKISLEISEAIRCCWPLSFNPELDTTIFDAIAMGLNPAIMATGAVPGIFLPLSEVSIRKNGWPPLVVGSESAASTAIFLFPAPNPIAFCAALLPSFKLTIWPVNLQPSPCG